MTKQREYEARLELYLEAERAILEGAQSYSIGSRSLSRAELSEVRQMISYLEKRVAEEKARERGGGKNKTLGVIPRDV